MRSTERLRPRHIALPLLAAAAFAAPAQADVSAGRNLEMAHSIEFGVFEGWPLGATLKVEVFRGTTLIATKTGDVEPGPKPGTTTFEINHVGGGDCWEVTGGTPDIQPGDKVVATVLDGDADPTNDDVNYTFVRDIGFEVGADGVTLVGHARGDETSPGAFSLTAPLNLTTAIMEAKRVGQGERDVLPSDLDANGNFSVVLPGDGGEVFIDWVHELPGGGTETTTTFPDSEAGELPCGPRLTTALTQNTHPVIDVANVGTDMVVGGPRLHTGPEPVTVSATFDGVALDVVQGAGTWSAVVPASTLASLPDGGTFSLVATFSDGAPPQSRLVAKDVTAPVVRASLASGSYTGPQGVALSSDGAEDVRYTLDGSLPRASSRVYDGTPIALGVGMHVIKAFSTDAAGNRTDATFEYDIVAPATAAAAAAGGQNAAGGALPAIQSGTTAGATTRPFLRAFATPPRVKRSRASRYGVRVVLRVGGDTKVVRMRVYRRLRSGRRLLIGTAFRAPRGTGVNRLSLREPQLRRKLRIGSYEVEATPGTSRSNLGRTARARFRVLSG